METNNIENGMKVYFDGDSEWYASPLNIEETKKWAAEEYGYGEELEFEECDLDNDGAWIVTEDEEYMKALGDYDEKCYGGIGDLRKSIMEHGKVDRLTSFREILKRDGYSNKPYEIASTNY